MIRYLMNILLVIDQAANVLLLGDPDETISARCGKKHPRLAKIIDAIFWFDPRHCERAYRGDPYEGKHYLTPRQRKEVLVFYILVAIAIIAFQVL